MAKKSFFEKISGTIGLGEEEKTAEAKRKDFREEPEEEKKAMPIIEGLEDEKEEEKVEVMEKEKEKEKWAIEPEGQLTVDVYQTETDIVVKSTIAGVKSGSLDISITNDILTIKGKREKDEDVKPENYYYQELYWGPFSRSIILPVDVESEKIGATLKNGILTVRLPKAEKIRTRKIEVKGE